jgi:hypothetical protein
MRFPYSIYPAKPDAAFPDRKQIRRPLLRLHLQYGQRSIFSVAIVDSGADSCLFPASIARQLGIPIPNQRVSVFSGTADTPQLAYFETVKATISNPDATAAPVQFDLYAGFCETLEHVGLGLLGQNGFFSRFSVSFDYAANSFDVI